MTALTDAIDALSPTHYWKLDEASGTEAADSGSGTAITMTHVGSPFLAVNGPTNADVGVAYNGTSQLTRGVIAGADDLGGSNTGTLLFFYRADASAQMVTLARSTALDPTWQFQPNGSGFAGSTAVLSTNGSGSPQSIETATVNAAAFNEWHMIAFVHTGTVMTGWSDGGFIAAANFTLSGSGGPDGSAWLDFSSLSAINRLAFGALDRSSIIFGECRISNVAYFDGVALTESQLQGIFDVFEAGSSPITPPTPPVVLNAWNSTIFGLGVHHIWRLNETTGDALDTGATGGFDMVESNGSGNRWRLAPGPIRGQPREYALWGSQSLGGGLRRVGSGLAGTGFSTGALGGVIFVWSTNDERSFIVHQIYNSNSSHLLELTVEIDGAFQMRVGVTGGTILTARTATGLAIDGTSFVVMGIQRADGTGIRIFVDGVDLTDSNVAGGSATVDSFPNDVLAGESGTTITINTTSAGGTAAGGALISNPFVFVNSVPTDIEIAELAASALIDTTQLSDYFETAFLTGGTNFLFWLPGWKMNANNDFMEVGNDLIEQVIFSGTLPSPSSFNNLESGGVGEQIISEFNNYFWKYGTNNQGINATTINTSAVGTFNFIGRISSIDTAGFNVIMDYGNGAFSPDSNVTSAWFFIVGSTLGYKWGMKLTHTSGDFLQILSGSFIVPEPDAITMLTIAQDGTGLVLYVDGELNSADITISGTTYALTDWVLRTDQLTGTTSTAIGHGVGSGSRSNWQPNEMHDLFMLDKAVSLGEVQTLWNAVNGVFPSVGAGGQFNTLLLTTQDGPDHYWRMNDIISILTDSGVRPSRAVNPISGQTIQQLGNPLQGQVGPVPLDPTAASIAFDGTLDAYEVGVNGSPGGLIDNLSPSSTGTIGFFFLPSALQTSNIIYSQGDTGYTTFLQVGFNQDKLEVIIQRLANSRVTVTSGNSMSSTLFNMVVITCNGSEYALYLNGQQDPETTTFVVGTSAKGDWFRAITSALSALSAKGTTGFTTETTGNVSEVYIYDPDVLTPEEVKALYDAAVIDGFLGEFPTEFHRTGITSDSHTMVVFDSGDQ